MIFHKHKEKRQYERLSYYCLVKYRLLGQKDAYNEMVTSLRNLSAGGMLLKTKEHFAVGSMLAIKINISSPAEIIAVNGQVVRLRQNRIKGGYWCGIKFSDIKEEEKEKLISFISAAKKQL